SDIEDLDLDAKVDILIEYLETNPTIGVHDKKLKNIFAEQMYSWLVEEGLYTDGIRDCECDDESTDVVMGVIEDLRGSGATMDQVNKEAGTFISDLLNLEATLVLEGGEAPFTTYYSTAYPSTVLGGGNIQIYRGSALIATVDGLATSYVDRNVPVNTSGAIKYHTYYLKNVTDCGEATGSSGRAAINPTVPEGTEIDVTLDLSVIIKEAYGVLFMELLNDLFEENGYAEEYDQSLCEVAREEFLERRSSENALEFILECYGGANTGLRNRLEAQSGNIITPLLRLIALHEENGDDPYGDYPGDDYYPGDEQLPPGIDPTHGGDQGQGEEGTEELEMIINAFMQQVIADMQDRLGMEVGLIDVLSSANIDLEELLGYENMDDIPDNVKDMLADAIGETYVGYFAGASHAAEIEVDVHDPTGALIGSYEAFTNVFGDVEVPIGTLLAGTEYTLEIGLVGATYFLPHTVSLELNNAEPPAPTGGNYTATVDFDFTNPFKYGDFDEDNAIDLDDISGWGGIIAFSPESFLDANIDGIIGIDLLDVVTLLGHWGVSDLWQIEEDQITLFELLEMFGLDLLPQSSPGAGVDAPVWIDLVGSGCL
ncbi:hypothetical protein KKF04_01880, partial [Patescibacteria group bacterium]|nr:hypothetical protein [Patescibacteria group bacterium]